MELAPMLVRGDLNSNKCWDEWDRWWNHTDVVRELDEIGIRSIYHDEYNEEQGAETRPTLFHQRNRAKPYHVDYMFASADLYAECELTVGDMSDWIHLSDHMPLTLEYR